MKYASIKHLASALVAALAFPTAALATTPVVVWDGAAADYKFDNLTRTVDDNTYTLNLNEQNTVAADGSYILIGPNNAQKAVTLTVQNSNPAVTNGFGTTGTVTVMMKCRNAPVSADSNRALISLMNGKKYRAGSSGQDNGALIGMCCWNQNACFIWQGGHYASDDDSKAKWKPVSGKFTSDTCVLALSYSKDNGTAYYVNGERIDYSSRLKSDAFTSPCGIALGGIDTDNSNQFYAMTNMQIEAVAVFTSTLTESEVGAYTFPSETTPTTGETYTYTNTLPTVSGDVFTSTTVPTWVTDPDRWTGTIWLKNMTDDQGKDINPNTFGNSNSTVRLTGVVGYFASALSAKPAVELVDDNGTAAVEFVNGYGRGIVATLAKLCGTGTMKADIATGGSEVIRVKDWSEFTGTLNLTKGKVVSFDDKEVPDGGEHAYANSFCYISSGNESWGVAYVATNATLAIPKGKAWTLGKGIHVAGAITLESLARRSGSTTATLLDGATVKATQEVTQTVLSRASSNVSGTWNLVLDSGSTIDYTFLTSLSSETNIVMRNGGAITGASSINASGLATILSKVSGDITFAYSGSLPPANVFTSDAWKGTVKISNIETAANFDPGKYGNAGSTIELSGIGTTAAHFSTKSVFLGRLVLRDNNGARALALDNGYTDDCITIGELAGDGTFSKDDGDEVSQGITINVMTNFTGTLALTNMTVTFGTTNRAGRTTGHGEDNVYKRMVFIDPDAVISVPAGFALWNPPQGSAWDPAATAPTASVFFNGTVNFTTEEEDFDTLTLLKNVGTGDRKVYFGPNAVIKVNGEEYDKSRYAVKVKNSNLLLENRQVFIIHIR